MISAQTRSAFVARENRLPRLRQPPRFDLADQLQGRIDQIAIGAIIEPEHGGEAAFAFSEYFRARAMLGAAQQLLEFLALRDQARGVLRRPGEHDRHLHLENAWKGRSFVVLARVGAEIRLLVLAGVAA